MIYIINLSILTKIGKNTYNISYKDRVSGFNSSREAIESLKEGTEKIFIITSFNKNCKTLKFKRTLKQIMDKSIYINVEVHLRNKISKYFSL